MVSTTLSRPPFVDTLPLGIKHDGVSPPGAEPSARPGMAAALVLYIGAFAVYLAVGLVLMLHYGYYIGDGLARTANASYVLFSRNPHLAAVGFVWNPLPSLAEVPLLVFKDLWPALLAKGTAGAIMAAAFMAGAVVQVHGIARDRGLSTVWVWGITLVFALNPMIVLYGGNGMSEAPYLFFTIWATRRLVRWLHTDHGSDLVFAGLAIGFNFLARYEAVGVAAGAAALVIVVTARRAPETTWARRIGNGLVDAFVLLMPFILSFVGWAVAGWLLTGQAFSQFSSVYGNSSQNGQSTAVHHPVLTSIADVVHNIVDMELLLPVILVIAVALAVRRRQGDVMVPILVLGGGIGFAALSYIAGSTIQNFRYYIMVIPLAVIAVAMIPSPTVPARWEPSMPLARRSPLIGRVGLGLLAALLLLPAVPIMWSTMLNPQMDPSDSALQSIVYPTKYPAAKDYSASLLPLGAFISSYLDSLHLPGGSVLVDTSDAFPTVMTSTNMRQFVMDSDLDYSRCLNQPVSCHVQYLLVPQPSAGRLDALIRRYPTLWATGAGIATLSVGFRSSRYEGDTWRLYAVDP